MIRRVRALAVLLIASLCMAFMPPLVVASPQCGMACCASGRTMACCPVDGACRLRSCSSAGEQAWTIGLPPLVLPTRARLNRPDTWAPAMTECAVLALFAHTDLPDPPPRG
jgi:hypothetical protein